jgi:hypothetical protein
MLLLHSTFASLIQYTSKRTPGLFYLHEQNQIIDERGFLILTSFPVAYYRLSVGSKTGRWAV